MFAIRVISVFIFNGLSKLAHKRSSMAGDPVQLPYPRKVLPDILLTEQLSETLAEKPIFQSETCVKKNSPNSRLADKLAIVDEDDLLTNEYKLKQFLLRFEEDFLDLLDRTGEGVKVPRPVPYPTYLQDPPDIPVAHTHTSVLRRLYNDEKIARTVPDNVINPKTFPRKPPVPKYKEPTALDLRINHVKFKEHTTPSSTITTSRNQTENKIQYIRQVIRQQNRAKETRKKNKCRL